MSAWLKKNFIYENYALASLRNSSYTLSCAKAAAAHNQAVNSIPTIQEDQISSCCKQDFQSAWWVDLIERVIKQKV